MTGLAKDRSHGFKSVRLLRGVGETVYGLDARFAAFVKNGQSVGIWNADVGTASERRCKDIPFSMTGGGRRVFVNDRGRVSFEVDAVDAEDVRCSAPDETIDFCAIYGSTPKRILECYTRLTGRPGQVSMADLTPHAA
ncbi:alpha-glucosidase [Bifidobacterium italicum]|uniref:Alpha-glucosidase n=1 Tax=Bifidobacterium italicum TaxID=1960968 RepID=A0A2A2EL18_9BIFI|nr:hypothetical protein [Bifidobacterium italicum]PAU69586.1 alpha-glucosidase [Bifidobacterium italicum]